MAKANQKMTQRDQRILEGMAIWGSFYRENIDIFVEEYLHIQLRLFQRILLVMMNHCATFVFIASRGIGKTFIAAIFAVSRCILYPGTKICVASGTRGQSLNLLEKITLELKQRSPELRSEINEKETSLNAIKAQIVFKNGSYIKVVTASDSARGNRANLLLLDEFRMISKEIVDTILRKFLTQRRMPEYAELTKAERNEAYSRERNKIMYLSSAFFKDSWCYTKSTDTCRLMLDDTKSDFVCGLPYELPVCEGLIDKDVIESEMVESDFNEIRFMMEYEARFYGDSDGSFFDFTSISKNRRIQYPMLPGNVSIKVQNNKKVSIVPKQQGEVRILSADIALMSSKKHNNDATAIFVNRMLPTKSGRYTSNIVYCDAAEGLHTKDQALMIRRLYEEFDCDYLVLDCNGVGLGVYDELVRDMVDPDTGDVYPAISCCNDQAMADRCVTIGAKRVIWSIKSSAAMNSECAIMLREGFKSGKIRLLCNEYDAEPFLDEIKGYKSLDPQEKLKIQLPYIHTTLLVNELVQLKHEESNGKIKIKEKANARKDRYSSLSYNYYVANQIEGKLSKHNYDTEDLSSIFIIKPPSMVVRGRPKRMKDGDGYGYR